MIDLSNEKNYINNELRRLVNYYKKYKELEKKIKEFEESEFEESEESEFQESEEEPDEGKKIYGRIYKKI